MGYGLEDFPLLMKAAPVAALIFIAIIALSLFAFTDPVLKERLLYSPSRVYHGKQWWLLFTGGFIHGDIFHLAFNGLAFWYFAFDLEILFAQLGQLNSPGDGSFGLILGHAKFFIFYFACLLLSSLPLLPIHKNNPAYRALGASGAVVGLVASGILFFPGIRIWGIPGWLFLILYLGVSYLGAVRKRDNIGHEAHFFGALAGLALSFALYPKEAFLALKHLFS